jgi:hypothetical protein
MSFHSAEFIQINLWRRSKLKQEAMATEWQTVPPPVKACSRRLPAARAFFAENKCPRLVIAKLVC